MGQESGSGSSSKVSQEVAIKVDQAAVRGKCKMLQVHPHGSLPRAASWCDTWLPPEQHLARQLQS